MPDLLRHWRRSRVTRPQGPCVGPTSPEAGYEPETRPAPPSHRWDPWPCGQVTSFSVEAIEALAPPDPPNDNGGPRGLLGGRRRTYGQKATQSPRTRYTVSRNGLSSGPFG